MENVLFYNIGNKPFTRLDLDEISFQLEQENNIESGIYKYEYNLSKEKSSVLYREPCLNFCFEMNRLTSSLKPLEYWFAVKHGVINQISNRQIGKFHIVLLIECPTKYHNLASLMKPMLDGIISAFHFETSPERKAIEYIAEQKHISELDVVKLLEESEYSLLGGRSLVSPFRNGIKWNPKDENCVGVNIRQVVYPRDNVKILGKIIE